MALSKSESTREISNLATIARIIFCPCTDILRNVLKKQITISDLKSKVKHFRRRTDIPYHLYMGLGIVFRHSVDYPDFDIPMIYFFLKLICGIPLPDGGWGRTPSEKDRSLSANIERIYIMRKKYISFESNDVLDSTFVEDLDYIFQAIKELEEEIGSGTTYQDVMKKIKMCSMDPDVEHIFIEKLGEVKFEI